MAGSPESAAAVRTRERPRRPDWLGAAPGAAVLAIFAAGVGLYLASAAWTGQWAGVADPTEPLQLDRSVRFTLVVWTIFAFSLWSFLAGGRGMAGDLDALAPLLELEPEHLQALRQGIGRPLPGGGVAAALGMGVGVGVMVVSLALGRGLASWTWSLHQVAQLVAMLALFGALGLLSRGSQRAGAIFSSLGRHTRVRLLDTRELAPFARLGLRLARYWLVGSALALLLVVDANAPGPVAAVIVVTVALGVTSLLRPCLGIHRRLREVKDSELERVRLAIEARSAALLDGRRPETDAELPALLAYEARIASVSEWPFDTPFLVRFGALLLIPLGSWLGGALVERLVDGVLG